MTDQERWDALFAWGEKNVPGFKVRFKDESLAMRTIGRLLFFNRSFMTDYFTTIGTTVYVPNRSKVPEKWRILAHELVHGWDATRQGKIRFGLAYLFPQCLAPLALLAIVAIMWPPMLFALVCLLALLPWPAPGRTARERRGYLMTAILDDRPDPRWFETRFSGSAYYWMDRHPNFIAKDLLTAQLLRNGSITVHPHSEILAVLK